MASNTDHPVEEIDPGVYTLACGDADAHLLVSPNGTTGLIDADRNQVVEELNELFGQTSDENTEVSIDFLHTTHIHQDHVGGIRQLSDAGYVIDEAYQPPESRVEVDEGIDDGVNPTVLGSYYAALSDHGIDPDDIQEVTTGKEIFREGDVALTALSPPATIESVEFDHPVTGEPCEYGCEKANPNSAACRYDGPHHPSLAKEQTA
jgi:glyoxylase-like metal-dependent hydrolase (beta-lactamase superfamily II)